MVDLLTNSFDCMWRETLERKVTQNPRHTINLSIRFFIKVWRIADGDM